MEIIWKQYIIYLTEWAKDHRDPENYSMSPADFEEWYSNEFAEADDLELPTEPDDDGSNIGCKDCPDDECTGHCMSCSYRPI